MISFSLIVLVLRNLDLLNICTIIKVGGTVIKADMTPIPTYYKTS